MKRRTLTIVCVILAVLVLVAGCGKENTPPASGTPSQGSGTNTPDKKEVTLKYWAAPLASNEKVLEVWTEVL